MLARMQPLCSVLTSSLKRMGFKWWPTLGSASIRFLELPRTTNVKEQKCIAPRLSAFFISSLRSVFSLCLIREAFRYCKWTQLQETTTGRSAELDGLCSAGAQWTPRQRTSASDLLQNSSCHKRDTMSSNDVYHSNIKLQFIK